MKKVKLISLAVILLSVIALGVFMGKQMFKLMEADSVTSSPVAGSNPDSSVKILYTSSESAQLPVTAPETSNIAKTPVPEIVTPKVINKSAAKATSQASAVKMKFSPDGPKWLAYSSGNGINVRKGNSTKTKRLFKVAKGTKGTVLKQKDGWTQIKWDFNRKIGWVRNDLLVMGPANVMLSLVKKSSDLDNLSNKKIHSASQKELLKANKVAVAIAKPAPVEKTVKRYIKGDKLPENAKIIADPVANIRSGPSTGHSKVGKLPKGVTVQIKDVVQKEKWQWFEIIFHGGKKSGWTREDNLAF